MTETQQDVTITKTYQTPSGKTIRIEGTLQLSEIAYTDGDNIRIPRCDIDYYWYVDGVELSGWIKSTDGIFLGKYNHADYPYIVGNLLVSADGYDLYQSIKAELEAHPAITRGQTKGETKMKCENTDKVIYYGETLKDAYANCMADQHCYDDNIAGYSIISAQRLAQSVSVGFISTLCEAWEFELFLHYSPLTSR